MAQVQTPREFKFVGGPSRKRRRNGTVPTATSNSTTVPTSSSSTSPSAKHAKRACGPSTGVRSPPSTSESEANGIGNGVNTNTGSTFHHPLPSSPLPLYDVDDLLSASPRTVFSRMTGTNVGNGDSSTGTGPGADESLHPDITNTIAATLAGLASSSNGPMPMDTTSSPGSESSATTCESIHHIPAATEPIGSATQSSNDNNQNTTTTNNTTRFNNIPTPSLEGILDWPTEEFMNPFFPAVGLDVFGGSGSGSVSHSQNNVMNVGAVQVQGQPPTMMLPLPSPSPPQMSSLPPLVPSHPHPHPHPHSHPNAQLADDVEELPSHLDSLTSMQLPSPLSSFVFDQTTNNNNGKQQQQMVPADALMMATSPRMYAQPSILYDTISRIFFQYDQEFCILPLTCDFAANPFRYNMQAMQQSSLLRHCILALSYRHVDHDTGACTSEATAYKRRATEMLNDKIRTESAGETQPDASLLDASIVLMTLDCATSALGPWQSHLRRAKKLIQQGSKAKANTNSASSPTPSHASSSSTSSSDAPPRHSSQRLAQLGLLVWFDVTLALTSRNGCIFPERIIMSIFDPPEPAPGEDTNTNGTAPSSPALDFYAISGCPRELFECMVRLAAYAREMRIASSLSCVRFDMGPVLRLERRIAQWQSPAFDDPASHHLRKATGHATSRGNRPHSPVGGTADAAESAAAEHLWRTRNIAVDGQDDGGSVLDYRLDLYHCAEAWRYALLIYIERVFKWQDRQAQKKRAAEDGSDDDSEGSSGAHNADDNSALLQFLARRTLNHITSCRRTTFVQKQLMLPVFLAGAEIRDAGLQNDARDYCVWWGTKTRYNMFITGRALLEEVWRRRAVNGEDTDVWWGDVFDQKGKSGEKEYLLG